MTSNIQISYQLDGQPCEPANHKELQLELNFDSDSPDARLLTNKWKFVRDDAKYLSDKFSSGISGGLGIYDACLFDVLISDKGVNYKFTQYLDPTDLDSENKRESIAINDYELTLAAKEYGRIHWLNDIADSFTFQFLHEQTTFLPTSMFVHVPYILNPVNNWRDIMITTISIVFITDTLEKAISDITALITSAANPFESWGSAIKLIANIIHIVIALAAFVALIIKLITYIIQPVKYHSGMYVRDLMKAGCDKLGLKFKSPGFLDEEEWKDLFILPEKFETPQQVRQNFLLGFITANDSLQTGYYRGTFGDFLRSMKIFCNGKVMIKDNTLYLVRWNYNLSTPKYQIPDILNREYKYNANEIIANEVVEFRTDNNDENTLQEYAGTYLEATTTPNTVSDTKRVLVKGFKDNQVPFALGREKTELTLPEEIINDFVKGFQDLVNGLINGVNAVIGFINGVIKFINTLLKVLKLVGVKKTLHIPDVPKIKTVSFDAIEGRLRMLKLTTDQMPVPKIFLLKRGKKDRENLIYSDNSTRVAARNLWDKFYFIDSFVPSTGLPNGNQYIRRSLRNIPFSFQDFVNVYFNNYVYASDGKVARIESLKWNPWKCTADLDYRENKLYTKNLKLTLHDGIGY